ncbi:MAG: hypothetical protein ABSH56_37000 [Bryobacteraceae bacterium]|jgi:hypothetical protein
MRLCISLLWLAAGLIRGEQLPYFHMVGGSQESWASILGSIGMEAKPMDEARVFVAGEGAPASTEWMARIEEGAFLILEGQSPLAEQLGFRSGQKVLRVGNIRDVHRPDLPIIWEKPLDLTGIEVPEGARVFARERWTGTPVEAGLRQGKGGILWIAAAAGARGYERFPYLLQALCELGFEPSFRGQGLWAFFDSAYRSRVDLDYFAARWRAAGIAALHVAAWHFQERDKDRDEYLEKLIAACHREGILVYAWFELPHVSDQFWEDHPAWREKTAVLQDAQLDWRKLMNLDDPACFRAAAEGVRKLVGRFDWDGVNLAELYFESLEGMSNPARFTPMNDTVRARFRQAAGFDPLELFGARKDEASVRAFLDFRRELAREMQSKWVGEVEALRAGKPDLDLVLTHVDDRFDAGMRDAIGADVERVMPLLDTHKMTLLIEDPATVWNLGPQRYSSIAERYRPLTPHRERLAIDINIVERYQDVYPTKQQTGVELFELVHNAAKNFQRVALYFENSLLPADLPLLPMSAAAGARLERSGDTLFLEAAVPVGLAWQGAAVVDGRPWPVRDDRTLWLPAGRHRIERANTALPIRLLCLNGELDGAAAVGARSIRFSYHSTADAFAMVDRTPDRVQIDGATEAPSMAGPRTLRLPRGRHSVTLTVE